MALVGFEGQIRLEVANIILKASFGLHWFKFYYKHQFNLLTSNLISPSFQGGPTIFYRGIFLILRINVLWGNIKGNLKTSWGKYWTCIYHKGKLSNCTLWTHCRPSASPCACKRACTLLKGKRKESTMSNKKREGTIYREGGLYKKYKFLSSLQSRQGVA